MSGNVLGSRRDASSRLRSDGAAGFGQALTVLLVDARPWTREAFAQALEAAHKDLRVLCFSDIAELAQTDEKGLALVVLNLTGLQGSHGCASSIMARLRPCLPSLPVVALSDRLNPEDILRAVEQGLNGYIPISMEVKLVIDVLHFVAAGGTFVPADLLLAGLGACKSSDSSSEPAVPGATGTPPMAQDAAAVRSLLNTLTPRERSVLHVLRQGKSNKHIARELDMCEATVKVHVRHIMRKLGVANRTQVALLADHLLEK